MIQIMDYIFSAENFQVLSFIGLTIWVDPICVGRVLPCHFLCHFRKSISSELENFVIFNPIPLPPKTLRP